MYMYMYISYMYGSLVANGNEYMLGLEVVDDVDLCFRRRRDNRKE